MGCMQATSDYAIPTVEGPIEESKEIVDRQEPILFTDAVQQIFENNRKITIDFNGGIIVDNISFLVVFGYIRQQIMVNLSNYIIPQEIYYTCLLFYYSEDFHYISAINSVDRWDF